MTEAAATRSSWFSAESSDEALWLFELQAGEMNPESDFGANGLKRWGFAPTAEWAAGAALADGIQACSFKMK